MLKAIAIAAAVVACAALVRAQDPADGWLGYATGVNPSGEGRITYMSAQWTVGQNPAVGGAFFSPWFGIEASDNLNLIQPVNPWVGDSWQIYNEYFQWYVASHRSTVARTQRLMAPYDRAVSCCIVLSRAVCHDQVSGVQLRLRRSDGEPRRRAVR